MTRSSNHRVLAINFGSSCLKAALYRMGGKESLVLSLDMTRTNEELMIARHAHRLLS